MGALAVLVYLPGFWWGAPRAQDAQSIRSWGVDDESPIGPLAQVHNILEPKEFQNLGYPLMHSFMAVAAYAPYLGFLWLEGDFEAPSDAYPYGLADPVQTFQVLTWLAHLLSVVLGAGVVVAAVVAARRLWGEREALWAGAFTLLSYPMFYYARTGNVDVPALFFVAAALAVYAGILRGRLTVGNAVWLGVWAGFAAATKETSAAAFVGVPPVLLWLAWRGRGSARHPGAHWRTFGVAAALGVVACAIAFGLGSGLFVDPERYFAHLAFNRERSEMMRLGEIAFMTHYPATLAGSAALFALLVGYLADACTVPGLLLAAAGVAVALRGVAPRGGPAGAVSETPPARGPGWSVIAEPQADSAPLPRRRSGDLWMVVPLVTYLAVLFFAMRNGQLRYVMPAAFVIGLFAARGLVLALDAPRLARWGGLAAAGWILVAGGLRATDLTQQMIRDSRYAATAWLEANLGPGDRLEFFGPDAKLPWLPAGIEYDRANEYLGAVHPPKRSPQDAERIRRGWAERRPDVILLMPDVSSRPGEPHNATCPPEIFDDLEAGRLGYEPAATFQTPRLFPWLPTPRLDYPSVNPPIRLYIPTRRPG